MSAGITPERLELAKRCLDDGWPYRQITLTHRISARTLRRHFPGRGMPLREAAKLGYAAMKTARQTSNK